MIVPLAAKAWVAGKAAQTRKAFGDQLPDVLQLLVSSMRSGFSAIQALDAVAQEAEEPARSEFAHVLAETRIGRDLSDSLAPCHNG